MTTSSLLAARRAGGGDCNDQHSASGAAIGPAGDSCTNSAPSDRCYNEGGLPQGAGHCPSLLRQQGASPSSPGYTARADELNRERSSAAGNQVVMILVRQCAFVGVLEETRDIGGSPSRSRCRHNATIMIDTSDEDNDTLSPGSSPHPRRGLQRSLKQGNDLRHGGYQAEGADLRPRRRRERRELARAEAPPALARRIRLRLLSSRGREQCGSSSALGRPGWSGLGPRYHCRFRSAVGREGSSRTRVVCSVARSVVVVGSKAYSRHNNAHASLTLHNSTGRRRRRPSRTSSCPCR